MPGDVQPTHGLLPETAAGEPQDRPTTMRDEMKPRHRRASHAVRTRPTAAKKPDPARGGFVPPLDLRAA